MHENQILKSGHIKAQIGNMYTFHIVTNDNKLNQVRVNKIHVNLHMHDTFDMIMGLNDSVMRQLLIAPSCGFF